MPRWLDCGRVDGVVTVRVNGVDVGCRYRAPFRFNIEDALQHGLNRIELTLSNTAQNLFGPHRSPGRDALAALVQRGSGKADYHLARFGIGGPLTLA